MQHKGRLCFADEVYNIKLFKILFLCTKLPKNGGWLHTYVLYVTIFWSDAI